MTPEKKPTKFQNSVCFSISKPTPKKQPISLMLMTAYNCEDHPIYMTKSDCLANQIVRFS